MTTKPEGTDPAYDTARVQLGTAVRRLGDAVVKHEADLETVNDVTESIQSLIDHLAAHPRRVRDMDFHRMAKELSPEIEDGQIIESHIARPGSGPGSPHGLDMVVRRKGDLAEAKFSLGASYEGAPGRSHGGIVALAFDDVMGFVLSLNKTHAFTGEITIRYKAATPLETPLVIQAWLARRDGRKLFMEAEMREDKADAPIIASATALFIQPNF